MMEVENLLITSVPSDIGSVFRGKAAAPDALIEASLPARLTNIGYRIVQSKPLSIEHNGLWKASPINSSGVRNEEGNIAVCSAVEEAISSGFATEISEDPAPFHLILGGECCMLPAVLTSFWKYYSQADQKVGLLYIDGDCDLTVPGERGSSGNFASMTMTHLTLRQGALKSMKKFVQPDGKPVVDNTNIVLFGLNMASAVSAKREHLAYLFDEGFRVISSPAVALDPVGRVQQALEWLKGNGVEKILVHLDVDSIDAGDFPLANVPNYTGISFEQIMSAVKESLMHKEVAGLVVAEVNPDHDPGRVMTQRLVDSLMHGFEARAKVVW